VIRGLPLLQAAEEPSEIVAFAANRNSPKAGDNFMAMLDIGGQDSTWKDRLWFPHE
jgi:hypothetical protein